MSDEAAPKRADAVRNRERILDAAVAALATDPWASMERIAERAGVSRPTLYAHFSGRDALMDALTVRSAREVTAAIAAARPREGPPQAALQRVIVAAWATIGRYRGLVIVNRRRLSPARLRSHSGPAIAHVHELIERGRRTGAFDAALPIDWLLAALVELIHVAAAQVSAGALDPDAAEPVLVRSAAKLLAAEG